MSTRTTVILSLVLIALAVTFSLAAYDRLPDRMASHWGVNDEVNGTIARFWGAFLMPLIALGMLGLFLLLPLMDPMKANIATFRPIFNIFIAAMMVFLLYLHVLTMLWNLGFQAFRMSTVLLPGLGLVFILTGLMMRQAKRNYFIGIRTPWTLSSDRVWAQTHRLGGVLFIACGLVSILGVFFPGPVAFMLVLLPILLVSLVLVIYSYILYQQETHA
jgi:uncharacterized membrane protein